MDDKMDLRIELSADNRSESGFAGVDEAIKTLQEMAKQASETVRNLKHELASMRDQFIGIRVDDTEAVTKVDEFKRDVDSLHDKTVHIRARTDNVGGGGKGPFPWLGSLIAAAIPAISPLGAAGIGGLMGLASAAAPALAGTAGVAAVAHSNISPVTQAVSSYQKYMDAAQNATTVTQQAADIQKAAHAFDGLDASQRAAAQSLTQFESFWKSFSTSFEKPVLSMFTSSLSMLQTLLDDMRPTITASANAFNTLFKDASQALGSPFWKSFFSFLGGQAHPAIMAFGETIGNLTKGLAGLLMAFQPMATSMEQGLVRMTAEFAKWAGSLKGTKQFTDFLDYAKSSGSAVMSLIGNLVKLIGTLLKDLAPVGLALVAFVSELAKFTNQLLTTNPMIELLIKGITDGATAVLKFATNLMQNHRNLVILAADIGVGILAYLALSRTLTTTIQSVKNMVGGFKSMIKFVAELPTRIGLMVLKLQDAAKATVSFTRAVVKNASAIARTTLNIITQTARIIAQTVAWTAQKVALGAWLGIQKLVTAAQWAWNAAMDANPIAAITLLVVGLGVAAYELIKHWSSVKQFFVNMWDDIKSAFTKFGDWVGSWIQKALGPVESAINHIKSLISDVGHFLGIGGSGSGLSSPASAAPMSAMALPGVPGGSGGVNVTNHITVQGHVLHESELTDIVNRGQYHKMTMQGKF